MNIKIIDVNGAWVTGVVNNGEYEFEGKVFEESSQFGINQGNVSKLLIREGNTKGFEGVFVNYDRGWDIEPETEEEQSVFLEVLDFLSN